ncbi:MAG: C39 family peptidase [Treponema sp.]|nr:C39 family peptidase [Treponema sp.]
MKLVFRVLLAAFSSFLLASCAKKYATGLEFDPDVYESLPRKARLVTRAYENLPTSVSLVSYTPYPGDQGQFGTCVSWATSYAGMTTVDSVINSRTDRRITTGNVFSPYYLFQSCNPGDRQGNGMTIETAMEFLKNNGVPYRSAREAANVDNFGNFDAPAEYEGSTMYRIGDYATLFSYTSSSSEKISSIKKSLSEHKPVVISFLVYNSFSRAREYWEPSYWDSFGQPDGHAMLVVGYDDSRRGGSFLIQNSWGSGWGRDGYVWIPYEDFASCTRGAYEMSTAIIGDGAVDPLPFNPYDEPEPAPRPEMEKQLVYEGAFKLPVRHEKKNMELFCRDGVYETDGSYDSLTSFQLYMTNSKPCYVYAFASDETTGKANVIFPLQNTSPLLDYSDNTIVYPAEDKYIQMDNVPGTDYFVVLYSPEELDIDSVISHYEKAVRSGLTGRENFYKRVQKAVGKDKLMDTEMIDFSPDEVSFKGYAYPREKRKILPVLMQISHE